MRFSLSKKSRISAARTARLALAHGTVMTPMFMPIATRGAVRVVPYDRLNQLGVQMLLANTYHLFLRPGIDIIKRAGGLHKFAGFSGPILTDSGGFQVFSLSKLTHVTDEGVEFASPIDGRKHFLTPEAVIDLQLGFGSDVAMLLDDVVAYPATHDRAREAVMRTTAWAQRAKAHFVKRTKRRAVTTNLFAIVQGSTFTDLRLQSAKELVALNFPGYAIGGLSVGEPMPKAYRMIEALQEILPEKKPRYLMGVGNPEQILQAVRRGVDLFDCVIPTRNARHGLLYIRGKKPWAPLDKNLRYSTLRITKAQFAKDFGPVDPSCDCYTCTHHSRAYLRHLFSVDDPVAKVLATQHNLRFYFLLMENIRAGIKKGLL